MRFDDHVAERMPKGWEDARQDIADRIGSFEDQRLIEEAELATLISFENAIRRYDAKQERQIERQRLQDARRATKRRQKGIGQGKGHGRPIYALSGQSWETGQAAADYMGVSRSAVSMAIKRQSNLLGCWRLSNHPFPGVHYPERKPHEMFKNRSQ